MRWIEKQLPPFRMVSTSSTTVQSLGEIEQRPPPVGCENTLFVGFFCLSRSEAGALLVRRGHTLKNYCSRFMGGF